jgi:type VI secretion system protein ImpJ
MPVARVILSEEGSPMLDPGFVPPLLIMDASPPLLKQVRRLHHRISTHIDTLVAQLAGTGRLYETQDTGQAERVLKLFMLNGACSHLESMAYTHGMTPLTVYQELCRLAGHLAIFTPARRPGNLPAYRHDDLAGCFARVIYAVRLGLDAAILSSYEMRYFEARFDGPTRPAKFDRLRVEFDPDWRASNRSIYLGVEGVEVELASHDCQKLMDAIDMKLGGATRVERAHEGRLKAFQLVSIAPDRPRGLPPGFVYYRIEGDPPDWQDVVQSKAMVLLYSPSQGAPKAAAAYASSGEPESPRIVWVPMPGGDGDSWRKISFALFIS